MKVPKKQRLTNWYENIKKDKKIDKRPCNNVK